MRDRKTHVDAVATRNCIAISEASLVRSASANLETIISSLGKKPDSDESDGPLSQKSIVMSATVPCADQTIRAKKDLLLTYYSHDDTIAKRSYRNVDVVVLCVSNRCRNYNCVVLHITNSSSTVSISPRSDGTPSISVPPASFHVVSI